MLIVVYENLRRSWKKPPPSRASLIECRLLLYIYSTDTTVATNLSSLVSRLPHLACLDVNTRADNLPLCVCNRGSLEGRRHETFTSAFTSLHIKNKSKTNKHVSQNCFPRINKHM